MNLHVASLTLPATMPLLPGETHTFSSPLIFQVQQPERITDKPVKVSGVLKYYAKFDRIHRCFASVSQKKDLFNICYPLEMLVENISEAVEKNSITIASRLRNIAPIVMGKEGPQKRRCFTVFKIDQQTRRRGFGAFGRSGGCRRGGFYIKQISIRFGTENFCRFTIKNLFFRRF